MKHAILATALAALSTLTADAALITWGAPQNITDVSDVSLNGTLVEAANFGMFSTFPTTTVNGVTFTAFDTSLPTTSPTFALSGVSFVTGNLFVSMGAPYNDLLFEGASGSSMVLTLSGLVIGETYEFQFWSNNSLDNPGRALTASTGASTVTLSSNITGVSGALGQYVLGTFVADSTSQTIGFSSTQAGTLNAAQLRNVTPAAVPEPGTALAGVMLAGLLGLRRRRKSGVIGEK